MPEDKDDLEDLEILAAIYCNLCQRKDPATPAHIATLNKLEEMLNQMIFNLNITETQHGS